jgi:predicted Zn-dependent protease
MLLAGLATVSMLAQAADNPPADKPNADKQNADKQKKTQNKKKDPDEIGNREVGKGVNFYSLEKEIGLGKGLAQEVERQAKIIDDPVIAEYVNRVGQNLVRNSDARFPSLLRCWTPRK